MTRHFLTLNDLSAIEIRSLLDRAIELKRMLAEGEIYEPMRNRALAMIFEKSSTRTRVSFEVAAIHFGGTAIFISPNDSHLGRGEPVADTARVLASMTSAVVMRTHSHERVVDLARHSSVPVINGLSDLFHPCQLLADLLTYLENRDTIEDIKVAWIGDGNNMCHSWANASKLIGFDLAIATPDGYEPQTDIVTDNSGRIILGNDPLEMIKDADLVVTDTWASMGQEEEKQQRMQAFSGFTVDQNMMNQAKDNALFMHCLPAYRGYEVTADVIEGPQSVVFQQAENRLHAQKALLEFLLKENLP
ncbi:MAG: ornithine carbamoyltransferase, catabolic [marine bacterium B5-7]|nr:MAG: ornithine carbamoyltransferase, catabolic [marine bacterium B5-7]